MLTAHKGYKILVAYHRKNRTFTVKWGIIGSGQEQSSDGFLTSAEARTFAEIQIDRDTALTVHKAQRREDDGNCLFVA